MGLFGKIKDILFDEEEVEVPVAEKKQPSKVVEKQKPIIQKEEVKNEIQKEVEDNFGYKHLSFEDEPFLEKKEEKKIDDDVLPRMNENRKVENTFRFPIDDFNENDFKKSYEQPAPVRTTRTNTVTVEKETNRDYDRYKITKKEEKTVEKRVFKPSPVISPVYGIMDKNYRKEDIQVKPQKTITKEQQKSLDVDMVRRKAYGTLEDEIEATIDKSISDFYKDEEKPQIERLDDDIKPSTPISDVKRLDDTDELDEPIKSIDELLIDSMSEDENKKEDHHFEKASNLNETFKLDEVIKEMKKNNEELSDEDDLFNLIDSMYEEREEDK